MLFSLVSGGGHPQAEACWWPCELGSLCSASETTRFPSSLSTVSSLWGVNAFSMLEPFNPLSFVESTIWPPHHAMSMLLVVQILASVNSSIWPCETTCSTHPVFGPLTTVFLSICPNDIHLLHEEYLLQSPLHSWNHQAIVIYLYHFSAPHGVALQNVHHPARVQHPSPCCLSLRHWPS